MIELMIVIAIIGIFAAIAIPAFQNKNQPKPFRNVPAHKKAQATRTNNLAL